MGEREQIDIAARVLSSVRCIVNKAACSGPFSCLSHVGVSLFAGTETTVKVKPKPGRWGTSLSLPKFTLICVKPPYFDRACVETLCSCTHGTGMPTRSPMAMQDRHVLTLAPCIFTLVSPVARQQPEAKVRSSPAEGCGCMHVCVAGHIGILPFIAEKRLLYPTIDPCPPLTPTRVGKARLHGSAPGRALAPSVSLERSANSPSEPRRSASSL